jgi:hypothetical protein
MARHRKIDVRMRSDEKFRALSAPPPNGQDCWIYLLTNRYTTSVPGVYAAFEETLARDLGWPLEGFRKAFAEVSSKGMAKADWGVGLVFIPKAFQYNPPENPNVVKSWRSHWDELPECPLKTEANSHLKASVEGMGKGFREAFAKVMPKQEQEQEQEQEPFEREDARGGEALDGQEEREVLPLQLLPRVTGNQLLKAWHDAGFVGLPKFAELELALNALPEAHRPPGALAGAFCAAAAKYAAAYLEHKHAKIPATPETFASGKHFGNIVEVMLGRFDVAKLAGDRAPPRPADGRRGGQIPVVTDVGRNWKGGAK